MPKQTHIILQLPDGKLQKHSINIAKVDFEKLLLQLRFNLENFENDDYLQVSRQVYNLLVLPMKNSLEQQKIKELVFVNDGMLRNLPMAALHDGEQFLVVNYAIANSLGLGLEIKSNLGREIPQQALLFGLSEATENSSVLPYVEREIETIAGLISQEKTFLNQNFSLDTFDNEVSNNRSTVLHIATHGKFGGTLENSFLRAVNGKINLSKLENILIERNLNFKQKIKLLALSACDTATGNERATLGMSGVALRSGVENTFGSLWSASDLETSSLVDVFYSNWLQDKMSLPESLRQAQLKLIQSKYQHPATWSGFILIRSAN